MGGPIATPATLTFTDVVPPGMTFKTVTGSNWSCLPAPPMSGGTTMTCTYTGTFPIAANQVLGSVAIVATGDNGPYTNCAMLGQPDGNASNDKACVTLQQDSGTFTVVKEVTNNTNGQVSTAGLTYPVSVTCGSNVTQLMLSDGMPQTVGPVSYGTTCQAQETSTPAPSGTCSTGAPAWTTTYDPPDGSRLITQGQNAVVKVKNALDCPTGGGGTLSVKKIVTTKLPIILSTASFPVIVTCGGTVTNLSVSSDGTPQTVNNIPAPSSCQVSEDTSNLPNVCPNGGTPTWAQPSIATSPAPIVAGQTTTVTVTNSVDCSGGGNGGGDKGYLLVTKKVQNDAGAPLGGLTFAIVANCGMGDQQMNLAPNGQDIVHAVPVGNTCAVTEPALPPAPSGGHCPDGKQPGWTGTTIVQTPPGPMTSGAGPVVMVTNTLGCVDKVGSPPPPPPPPLCPQPQVPDPKGGCMCPDGKRLIDGQCVSPPPKCAAPFVPNPATGQCDCPPGTRREGRACVKQVVCIPPAHLNKRGTACDCPRGMTRKGNTCVEREQPRKKSPADEVLRAVPGIIGNGVFRGGNGGGERRGGGNGGGDRSHPGGGAGAGGGGKGVR